MIKLSILTPMYNTAQYITKALDSIPRRDDIEVLVRDNASTDDSLALVKQYKKDHPELNLKVFANKTNKGIAYSVNKLLSGAQGKYYHVLDSDDYLYTEKYNEVIDAIDGEYDIYYINLKTNDGTILEVDPKSEICPVANTTKIVRREFASGLKHQEDRVYDSDWFFNRDLLARNPKCKYTRVTAYHYNYPREGSIMDEYFKSLGFR